MKTFLHSRYGASKGAALIIVLALVVLATGLSLAYLSRTTTNRQLAQSSYHDTSADLLARTALDITVGDLKQEIADNATVTAANIQPTPYGTPSLGQTPIPNLMRRSVYGVGLTSNINSAPSPSASPRRGEITLARWNSHYLIPLLNPTDTGSTPVSSFVAPDWVLITAQGPKLTPAPNEVIGRYAFAVYDEGGLVNMNLGGYPTYASLMLPARPTRPGRRLPAKYPSEESEIMLAAFTPNDACQPPTFTPDHTNVTLATGQPCSLLFNTNHDPTLFGVQNGLPRGLSIDTSNGNIFGAVASPGGYTVIQTCSNECGSNTATLNLTVLGFPSPETTPWPINVARKGTFAFADLTTLPSALPAPTPTTAQINKIMGWRNYATTQQPASASFDNPSFPPGPDNPPDPIKDLYARYFLGAVPPFSSPFTTVATVSWAPVANKPRTDQAMLTRQELIRLQRTIGFSQNLLQYLGTFSREWNRPAPDWPADPGSGRRLTTRWDMNNLALVIPTPWFYPGNHGVGHAYGKQRSSDLAGLFGLTWVPGTFQAGTRNTDPNYYGHWQYIHTLEPLPTTGDPDFFQVINYAMKLKNGGVSDPATVFNVGAAIIDQYDTEDLHDSPPDGSLTGNTITIIDYLNNGNAFSYAYGMENMSFDDPSVNLDRPPFAPRPPAINGTEYYALLNRRFENVGEFGYAYNPASNPLLRPSRTLDFASATSNERGLLDFFTYNVASNRAGIVNLNTRNIPVLASIIRGAWLNDPGGSDILPTPTDLVSRDDALAAGQAIVQETTTNGPVLNRADVPRLVAAVAAVVPNFTGGDAKKRDEKKQTVARALAEIGQARTWNLIIDVIGQTGKYRPDATDINQADKFVVQGEKRYWLHIALDRDSGTVLGSQLEEVIE